MPDSKELTLVGAKASYWEICLQLKYLQMGELKTQRNLQARKQLQGSE